MNINLHIERLVLDGLPVGGGQGALVQQAVERELSALLANGERHGALQSGGHVYRMQTDAIRLGNEIRPAQLGREIAGAVYGGFGE